MRKFITIGAILMLFAGVSSAATKHKHHSSATHVSHKTSAHHRHGRVRKSSWKRHGQQNIDSQRVTQIQEALIREKYLDGQPSGKWDTRTQGAMARFQSDNGWQNKVTPDSRALIKLGLGPDHSQDTVLNFDGKPADAVASNTASNTANSRNRQ
jgi:putative peptidoglycan binding protein